MFIAATLKSVKSAIAAAAALLLASACGTALVAAAAETAPVPAPAPAAATTSAPTEAGPEGAVMNVVHALRRNDAQALVACLPKTRQAEWEKSWTSGDATSGWRQRMLDRMLGNTVDDTASTAIAGMLKPWLGGEPARQSERFLGMFAGAVLAAGIETGQSEALQPLGVEMVAWLPGAGLDDDAKLKEVAAHILAALKEYGATDAAQLGKLSWVELLTRSGKGIAELKLALAVLDIQLDTLLDSVKVAKVETVEGKDDAKTLTVTYTAFGKPQELPIRAALKDGQWQVAADSPIIAWLTAQQRGGGGGWGMGMQQRQGNNNRQRRPGQAQEAAGQPQTPSAPPTGSDF